MLSLFTLLLFVAINAYDVSELNDFTADVDIYDMGMMGRGKNACIWNRSTKDKQEIFYYLAMQPWRHLVWTDCTGTECYKFFINEDASNIPKDKINKNKMLINNDNDYCRKEYANPLPTFDIDWSQINAGDRLDSVDINGNTCYKYPAQQPLAYIYLKQHYTKSRDVDVMEPCRYDFIGGKSITFRSFGSFAPAFISNKQPTGYMDNKTRCNIDPTPNNVQTDLSIVLGIADANVVQQINEGLSKLKDLTTVKQVKVYYISGDSLKRETVTLDNLASLKTKQISAGPIDALINTAKNELIPRINSKEIKRGTIIALMDRTLSSTFDAETAFDRNNITVHTIVYNPKNDNQMRIRARSLLSIGEHYHEFSEPTGVESIVNDLFIGIRTNLTERCDRNKCNGFCDARDRCTCPMCCENTCFFSYCNTTTATCMPWPEANPKKKIFCVEEDCVGFQECRDLEGCVYKEYKPGCAPKAKCMKPYCDDLGKCRTKSSCETDKTPSYENKCWNYNCNEKNGNCERKDHGPECPKLPDLCHQYICHANLTCTYEKKICVKPAQYADMDCYKSECNKKTGQCETLLNCNDALASYSGCGKTEGITLSSCSCNAASGFKCSCKNTNVDTNGFCTSEQICDSSEEGKEPYCRKSKCGQDLYKDGCEIKTCNEETGIIEWKEYDCTKNVTIKAVNNKDGKFLNEAKTYCLNKFEILCDKGDCKAAKKESETWEAGCGVCSISDPIPSSNGYKKTYEVTYSEDCNYFKVTCPDGSEIKEAANWYKDGKIGKCLSENGQETGENLQCRFNNFKDDFNLTAFDMCHQCFTGASCYKATEFREYVFDKKTGMCDMHVINEDKIPGCSYCNDQQTGFVKNCTGTIPKNFVYTLDGVSKSFNYQIPKICGPGNQCIPDPDFDCADKTNGDIAKIFDLFKPCANDEGIEAVYHYSDKFDYQRYGRQRTQSQEFLDEAEAKAFCTYSYKMNPCQYCVPVLNNNAPNQNDKFASTIKKDRCEEKKQEIVNKNMDVDAFTYKCNEFTNQCDTTSVPTDCPPENCWYRREIKGTKNCEVSEIWTCADHKKLIETKHAKYVHPPIQTDLKEHYPQKQCEAYYDCDKKDNETCHYYQTEKPCEELLDLYLNQNKDFGCRIPTAKCDNNTLYCTFTEIDHPLNDTRFFQERDNVVFGDKCYNYTCQEFFNTTSNEIEHHWVLTASSVKELNKKPDTICDTVYCDSTTGLSVSERRQCNPIEDYGLSERMAQCFQCSCSLQTGENVLTMRPNTEKETYELDACGNCVVRDRATGNQINEVVECVLAQPVNLTGAIAGATVAASVVFGLIGSMVVVSIGALQTYQLVSSAMKNVISTTLENPEFVAADNEATNVLNNGD